MSLFGNSILAGSAGQGPSADLGETIDQSLRFRSGGSSTGHLSKTITTSASTSAITISFWVKLGDIGDPSVGGSKFIFSSGTGGGDSGNIYYDQFNQNIRFQDTSSYTGFTTQKLRNTNAWYHIVYRFDAANQFGKVYVNGQEHLSTSIATSAKSSFGAQTPMQIGRYATGTAGSYQNNRFSGYLAEFNMLFGSSLTPDNFARTNDDGVWVPKSLSDLTSNQYGALGFRFVFDSSAGLGDDTAPTGGTHASANDFTASGFDTAAISSSNFDNDIDYFDTPTSNHATLNPLSPASGPLSEANLSATSGAVASTPNAPATIRNLTSGDWYFEFDGSNGNTNFGIAAGDTVYSLGDPRGGGTQSIWFGPNNVFSGVSGSIALSPSVTFSTHILGIRINIDAGEITFYGEGTSQGTYTFAQINTSLSVNFANKALSFFVTPILSTTQVNWGQRPFVYRPSGLTNTGNLQTNNLPEPTIKNGKEHFDVVTWSGDGTNGRNITGLEFQPDLVWIKCRNRSLNHNLYDSVRGVTKHLTPNENYANQTTANSLTAFNSDGFQVGTGASDNTSSPASNYVAWCWKAGGTAVSNTDGTITSSVSANTDAGFSIISFTGNTTANSSVGHGLNQAPEFVITKKRDNAGNWNTYHSGLTAGSYVVLNLTDGEYSDTNMYNGTTNTVVNIGSYDAINANGENMIMYAWHSVEGFSKFGKYLGTGTTDNAFVYTGFRPNLVWFKSIASGGSWEMYDTTRSANNPTQHFISSNSALGETTGFDIDILSNGFKIRSSNGPNAAATGAIYMAFAENPFAGENAPPATAR